MSGEFIPVSFYFEVSVLGDPSDSDAQFKEATGISGTFNTEEISMGGENRFKYKVPTHASYENLVLKRGFVPLGSMLSLWIQAQLGSGLSVGMVTNDIMVSLLDPDGSILMAWTFIGAWPVKWSVSDFNSMENQLLIETLEFSYQYFIALPGFSSYLL